MTAYENAIEIKGVTKCYDGFTLDNISFDVPKGCIMGFIGQNGAGKTTTIRSLLHITEISSGEIKVLGLDHIKDETAIKKRISVVFDELPFHDVFTAKDMARIFEGMYPEWDNAAYQQYLERFQLPMKKKIGQFSKGMKMKLQIACALSHNAELLVMDEATTGLDPVVRDEILHIFMERIFPKDQTRKRTYRRRNFQFQYKLKRIIRFKLRLRLQIFQEFLRRRKRIFK